MCEDFVMWHRVNIYYSNNSLHSPCDIWCTGGCRDKLYTTPPLTRWKYRTQYEYWRNRQELRNLHREHTPGYNTRIFKYRWLVLSPSVCFSFYLLSAINTKAPDYSPYSVYLWSSTSHIQYLLLQSCCLQWQRLLWLLAAWVRDGQV